MKKSLVALMALICVLLLVGAAMAGTDYIPAGTTKYNALAGMKYIGSDSSAGGLSMPFTPAQKGEYIITATSTVGTGVGITI